MKKNPAKILVIDDDPGLLEAISDFLTLEGYQVDAVTDGGEALKKLGSNEYDLLITDIKMPTVGGIEILRRTKEIDREIPVIMITGFASLETAIEAVKAGAYEYISKPFDMEKFLNVIQRAIKERRLSKENQELFTNLKEVKNQLESRLNQIFALGEVSKVITNVIDLDTVLQAIINISSEITRAEKVALLILEENSQELVVEKFKGFDLELLKKLRIKLGEGIIGFCAQKRKPISRSILGEERLILGKKEVEILGEGEFLLLPINYRENLFGLLILADFPPHHIVNEEEIRVLSILSYQASIAINNSILYEKMQNRYLATLEVLVSALEAKCKNTRGHSQRVSFYAREFARFLKISEKEIMILEKACSVHDIGKIVIPESILGKPDRLTSEEMEQMRGHPLKGMEILIPLGIMKEIIPVVRNHHERYDGKGYPDALKDGEIPFEAKVVAIIDAFDAMTSPRSYKKGCLSQEEALKEIEAHLGTQFDPDLGSEFLKFAPPIIK